MDWQDGSTADEELPAKVKPRRIDGSHSGPAGIDSRPITAVVAAAADVQAAGAEESPVFHEVAADPALRAPEAGNDRALSEELAVEAQGLADALQAQLGELDERQSALVAREAALEEEWRACRAWHAQQLAELAEREESLSCRTAEMDVFSQREQELAARVRDCETLELALDERTGKLNEREASLVAREHDLRDRRQQVEREAAALARSQQLWQQTKAHDEQALDRHGRELREQLDEQLAERMEEIDAAKAQLAEQMRAVEQDRAALRREIDQWNHDRELAESRRSQVLDQREADAERRLSAVASRESALDTQQSALEQLRSEIMGAHRQALEMRLIAEQLWAQIKGLMTPAEITQSLANLRLKLAEQYEQEEKSLAAKKEELLALADKLAQQHAALKAQRLEFLDWRKKQQEEIARQAEHLCRRVQELSEERKALKRAA